MPTCLIIQHAEPEGPYLIGAALAEAGVEVDLRRIDAGDRLPADLDGLDGLVVLGGGMSAGSDDGFTTRRDEVRLLAEAVRLSRPTLGICLGAQLLAGAVGGQVRRNPGGPEIGWAAVHLTAAAADDPILALLPEDLTVLHWHDDTYTLPAGAIHLASSAATEQQAFRMGRRAWGLQFHLEVDEGAVEAWLDAFGDELGPAGTTAGAIRRAAGPALLALEPFRRRAFARFAELIASSPRPEAGKGLATPFPAG